jgi:NADPH:quinone reductase-like Zn-dependent oxidoreductase
MKAIRLPAFGASQVLEMKEVELPRAKEGEIVLRVRAAGVNPVDYKIRQGAFPKITEADLPLTLGRDVCGTPVEHGDGASPNEVIALLGWQMGGYAEYVAVPSVLCVPKPKRLTAVGAAAIPLAAMTAWQGLFQYGDLKPGQRILIHAGVGGVGHFAVQFAANCGAHVITTVAAPHLDFVRQLGAERSIDYKAQAFDKVVSDVDMVFDLIGGDTRKRSFDVLRRGGTIVSTLGQPDQGEAAQHQVRAFGYMTEPNAAQLMRIVELIDQGKVRPVISKTFDLSEAAAAQTYLEKEHSRGKVVLEVR